MIWKRYNRELTQQKGNIISADPIYQFSTQEIESMLQKVFKEVISQVESNVSDFLWNQISILAFNFRDG